MSIKVIVNGAFGRMGLVTQEAIRQADDLELVAALGKNDNLADAITQSKADVVIDFTLPNAVFQNTQTIIRCKARPVVGTSGLTEENIAELEKLCEAEKIGGIIAPNFSVGAILAMRYAQETAKYFPDCEIIEMHHEKKVDSPSGTAIKTAQMISKTRKKAAIIPHSDIARGASCNDIPVHAVRLPGMFANLHILFGSLGETLTIKHDSHDRNCMMPGVCFCCRKVMELKKLVYGLENII